MPTYKEIEKLEYDKEQTILTKRGCKPNPHKFAEKGLKYNFETKVLCPFCLDYEPLYKFPEKSGLRICVNCGNKMMLRTLVKNMTTEEFARWVFDYRLTGFWNKVYPSFKDWNQRLKELGLAYEFWENYNRLKGESVAKNEFNEDYE